MYKVYVLKVYHFCLIFVLNTLQTYHKQVGNPTVEVIIRKKAQINYAAAVTEKT